MVICDDNSILKCAYLGLCAFLDFENKEKDERLVIFGGQTYNSILVEQTNETIIKSSNDKVDQKSADIYIKELKDRQIKYELNESEQGLNESEQAFLIQ